MLDKVLRSVRFGNKVLNKIAGALFVVIGVLGVVGGAWYGYSWFHDEAEKERARNGTAPKIVAIQDFKRGTDVGPAEEVMVLAQALPAQIRQDPSAYTRWIIPLHATNAAALAAPIAFLAEKKRPFSSDLLTPAVQGKGPAGYLMRIDGRLVDAQLHYVALEKVTGAFDDRALVIEPFLDGRAAALAPADKSELWIGGLVLLISLGVIAYGVHEWRHAAG
jgi:hypothetical protein